MAKSKSGHRVRALDDPGSKTRVFIAGGIAGCVAKTVVTPLDRVKILFQTNSPEFREFQGTIKGALRAARRIYAGDGLPGIFQGHSATLLRTFPYAAVKFLTFETYKQWLSKLSNKKEENPFRHMLAGAMAGASAVFATYPLEVLRVRMAYEPHRKRMMDLILRSPTPQAHSGLQATRFYRGLMPTLYGVLPYAGISFFVYEFVRKSMVSRFGADKVMEYKGTQALVGGGIAGIASQTASYPLEIVRRRMQVSNAMPRLNTFQTAQEIFRTKGIRGFYVGLGLGYIKIVPLTMASFSTYEFCKRLLLS